MPEIIWNWGGDDVVAAAHSLVSAGAASADGGCLGPGGFWWKPSFSFCTVGVATQTLCHTLFSLSVCLPDGPWPSQPYLHLLAGPASHHRGRLLAGNTQLQSLCPRIFHQGCGFFLSFFFLLALQRWQFTKPQTPDVRAAPTLTCFVWCLSVPEESD